MKVIFAIDTTNNKEVTVSLKIDAQTFVAKKPFDRKTGQVVLPLLRDLLQEHTLILTDLTEIQVNPGPGSFTGIRVGIAIAQTLGYLLNIPVNGKTVDHPVEAVYV